MRDKEELKSTALDEAEWSVSGSGCRPWENRPRCRSNMDLVGPQTTCEIFGEESNPDHRSASPRSGHNDNWTIPRGLAVGRILPTTSQHKRMTHTNCCIYRVVPPDDEQ